MKDDSDRHKTGDRSSSNHHRSRSSKDVVSGEAKASSGGHRRQRYSNDDEDHATSRDERRKKRRDNKDDESVRHSMHKRSHKTKRYLHERAAESEGSGEKRHRKRDKDKHHKSSSGKNKRHKRDDDHGYQESRRHKRHDKDERETNTPHDSRPKKLKVEKSHLVSLGDRLGHPPDALLDAEKDYFAYHKHLWLYLYRDCSMAFNDLSSQEARTAFADFVKLYNKGALDSGYYAPTLSATALEECQTTRHKWSLKISDQEDKRLHILQEGIHKQTEYQATAVPARAETSNSRPPAFRNAQGDGDESVHQGGRHESSTPEQSRCGDRQAERIANRRLRDHVQTVHEEFNGGRTEGRERQMEKRRELSNKVHGASRDRQQELELNDDALYGGGGGVDFSRALMASKQRSAVNDARKQSRIAELEQNEANRRNAMLESLGLAHKIGKKIEIQPREDADTT